jgi:PAS domain S-box-containing protein
LTDYRLPESALDRGLQKRDEAHPIDLQCLEIHIIRPHGRWAVTRPHPGQAGPEALLGALPAAVYAVDAQGRITYFNRKAVELWGRKPELFDFDQRFCGAFRLWRSDGTLLPHHETPVAAAISGAGSVRDMEVVIERPDGTRVPVRVNVDTIFDDGGRICGAVNVFVDSAVREHREAALRHSEERYRSLVAATASVAWTTDARGAFVTPQESWERYTGQPWEEHREYGWAAALHPDDRERILRTWLAATRERSLYATQGRLQHVSGQYRHFDVRSVPVVEASGKVREWVGIITDVQERREAELALAAAREAAEAASRAKDEFLALLSHELRNPLAPIVTALQLLKLRGDGARTPEHAIIERQVLHVTRLVDDLLDVSRIIRGRIELRKQVISTADVIAQAIEMAAPLIEQRGHRLLVDAPSTLWVDVDVVRFAQVLSNLLTNAAKYTPAGGQIEINAKEVDEEVAISVRDNGVGLPQDVLDRIWDPFYQGYRSVNRSQGGLGLGLALVKSLVELHGGRVAARSEGANRGCEFAVKIPRAAVTNEANSQCQAATAPADSGHPAVWRLLVVDDNCDSADSLAEYLRELGHEVFVAYDPPRALASARDFPFDVAFLDIGLPVMDGYELMQRLRQLSTGRSVRFFAFTGYAQERLHKQTSDPGFDGYFVKPVDPAIIARALAGRPEGAS